MALRINTNVPFPSLVKGEGPILINKLSGIWTVSLTIKDLAPVPLGSDPTTQQIIVYDQVLQTFLTQTLGNIEKSKATAIFIIDNGNQPIPPGIKGELEVGFDALITRATLLADQIGSIVVDVWKAPYPSFPPTVANTITAGTPPTIVSDDNSQDATLTGWTTTITAGDVLRFNVDSATVIQRVCVALDLTRT